MAWQPHHAQALPARTRTHPCASLAPTRRVPVLLPPLHAKRQQSASAFPSPAPEAAAAAAAAAADDGAGALGVKEVEMEVVLRVGCVGLGMEEAVEVGVGWDVRGSVPWQLMAEG